MKRTISITAALMALALMASPAQADDPFAQGADALAVAESDGSSSLRAKLKLAKMEPDMVMLQVKGIDDAKFPACTFTGKVLKAAARKDKYFKAIVRGKTYRFAPVLKMRRGQINLKDKMTQNNLGACYYPPKTRLVVKVAGVDLKSKVLNAAAIYLK
jgi:hypothetical protein